MKESQPPVSLEKVCLLDPKAPLELSPQDGDGRFEWFLFGASAF
jgi:ribosome biogenesis SPOUT family RNA methylase Rps3